MQPTIQEVEPGELPDAVEPGEVTLVLGAPAIGKSHHLRTLGPSVGRLSEVVAVEDDELVVVDDFAAAVFDLDGEFWSTYEHGEKSLQDRSGGVVLVTRPRSFDWLCQHHASVSANLVETVDSVLVVRTPPSTATAAIEEMRAVITTRGTAPLRDDKRAQVFDRCTSPTYQYENPILQTQLGWYDTTVTPAAFLSLSKYDDDEVLVAADVRRVLADSDVLVGPLAEGLLAHTADLVPCGGLASRIPSDTSPAVRTAVALVAVALETDADWLAPFNRYRPLAPAAETLEISLDVPPGTIDLLRLFAAETPRAQIRTRLAETESLLTIPDADIEAIGAAMSTVGSALESAAWTPTEYGSSPLVGAWHWEEPAALDAAAAQREFPDSGDDFVTDDGVGEVGVDEVVEALYGGVVLLSGPKASGKRRLAASVATDLTAWGATVKLLEMRRPDHLRAGIDATPDAVVVATYNAEPARVTNDAGIRALADWVADGICSGALLICDDERREQLDAVADRAGCADVAAWRDRTEFELDNSGGGPGRTSRAVADDLLSAMGWPQNRSPSRRTLDVERVADQSTLAAIAGIPDNKLDATFVGHVFADAVATVARTARPTAAREWLNLVDDLVGDVGLKRSDTDGAIRYRGTVFGTAMAAVATENPTTDEWIEAIADCAITLTNETATPHGRDSVGGDCEPVVSAFATGLATLGRPVDSTGPNHAALACVDQVLHRTIDAGAITEEPRLTLLCRIYGGMTERIIDTVEDPEEADDALAPVAALVQQAAATNGEEFAAFVIGNSFASTFGAVAGAACPLDELSTWVDALGSRVRESLAFVQSKENRAKLLRNAYTSAIGFWGFEFDCPDDRIEPWLVALGEDLCRTATTADLDDPEAFVVDVYGQAVRHVVGYRDLDRAELLFGVCDRLVDTIAASGLADESWAFRASLHAEALAAFADIEHDDSDGVKDGPYGTGALPLPGSVGFEDWVDLYDASVRRAAMADGPPREQERFLTAVYCGALSTHVRGFADESESGGSPHQEHGPVSGISPRQERVWFEALTDSIEAVATEPDLVANPVAFLSGVFGDAALNWAADGEANRCQEWIASLVISFRESRWEIDGPSKTAWFDAFAETDAAILRAVLTRTDVGDRTHDRLVQAVLSQVETAATAADNPPHPVNYVSSVFGTALALAVEGDLETVRFGVGEVAAAAEDRADFEWVGIERADIFERIYAEALTVVGHSHAEHDNVDEWLTVVTDRIEATATRATPENPAAFVAGTYTRAYVYAVTDGVEAWRGRLDSELRSFAMGCYVDDPAEFLAEVYADVVVAGTTRGQPPAEIEACVAAVYQSIERASEAGVCETDDAVVRPFSRAAAALATENPRTQADHTYLLGQALRGVGGEDLEAAVFDGDCSPGESPE